MDRRLRHGLSLPWLRVFPALSVLAVLACGGAGTGAAPVAVDDLIAQLDSPSYDARKQATLDLIDVGAEAAAPLVNAIQRGSREVMMRAIHVLGQQARSDVPAVERAARAALQRTLQSDDNSAVVHARTTLRSVDAWRQANAIGELRKLGADTSESVLLTQRFMIANQQVMNRELFLADRWRGDTDDLRHLRWLTDVEQLYVAGPRFGDKEMTLIAKTPNLTSLILDRTSISADGLARLKTMPRLSSVDILYTPVTDEGIEHLTQIENLFRVGLKGVRVSDDAEKRLVARVGSNLDLHRGALLGVEAAPFQTVEGGCLIRGVTIGSAAEKGGLRPEDLITSIDGHKIESFAALKDLMAKRSGGEEVTIDFQRDNESKSTKVTLGEWPQFNSQSGFRPSAPQAVPRQIQQGPLPIQQIPRR